MARYFSRDEFACSHTGKNEISDSLIDKLDLLREACGFPFVITSGYRDSTHPVEAKKKEPGMHCHGIAADIRVSGGHQRFYVVKQALRLGFTGIGVAKTFVHVDTRDVPVMWVYG